MLRRRVLLPALGFAILAGACHHATPLRTTPAPVTPPSPTAPPPPPAPHPPPPPAASAAPPALSEDEIFARKSIDDLNRERPLADALFEVDQARIRPDAQLALQRDAQWLGRWQSVAVTVQGQCDERGTPEYNLALGSRRATAVKEYLASLGVPEGRISTISLGKEAPVCRESNDDCRQRNRRGHLVITGK